MDDEQEGRLSDLEAQVTALTHVITRLMDHIARSNLIAKDNLAEIMSETDTWPKAPECKEAASAVFNIMARSLQTAGVIQAPPK